MRLVYAAFMLMLAAWGTFAARRHFFTKPPWCARRWLSVFSTVLLVGGCLTSGVALLSDSFAPWMLLPGGVSYLAMLPLPCYFPSVTATGRRRAVRNVLFLAFAALLLMLGLGIMPPSAIGM